MSTGDVYVQHSRKQGYGYYNTSHRSEAWLGYVVGSSGVLYLNVYRTSASGIHGQNPRKMWSQPENCQSPDLCTNMAAMPVQDFSHGSYSKERVKYNTYSSICVPKHLSPKHSASLFNGRNGKPAMRDPSSKTLIPHCPTLNVDGWKAHESSLGL